MAKTVGRELLGFATRFGCFLRCRARETLTFKVVSLCLYTNLLHKLSVPRETAAVGSLWGLVQCFGGAPVLILRGKRATTNLGVIPLASRSPQLPSVVFYLLLGESELMSGHVLLALLWGSPQKPQDTHGMPCKTPTLDLPAKAACERCLGALKGLRSFQWQERPAGKPWKTRVAVMQGRPFFGTPARG